MGNEKVLALYDFASKQEYIYRTSQIKEIAGASEILSGAYGHFISLLNAAGIDLKGETNDRFSIDAFEKDGDINGEVLYLGGGNMMVLWKSQNDYINANKVISTWMLKTTPGLSLISCCVPFTGDFENDRSNLFAENRRRKNLYPAFDIPAVTPFTQIDPTTFLPVTEKVQFPAEMSLSADRVAKRREYSKNHNVSDGFDDSNGKLAVVYIDGNSMGNKLIACRDSNYDAGVSALRDFSRQVDEIYVNNPLEHLRNEGIAFRKIIGGGDEITVICRAEDALNVVRNYFSITKTKKLSVGGKSFDCTSCAGIAVFGAGTPFSLAYDVAEGACEFAKGEAHKADGNYFSFIYCHGTITGGFNAMYGRHEQSVGGKKYRDADFRLFDLYSEKLRASGRANVKDLGNAAHSGIVRYRLEVERVNSRLEKQYRFNGTDDERVLIYDMSEFFDLWFAKE